MHTYVGYGTRGYAQTVVQALAEIDWDSNESPLYLEDLYQCHCGECYATEADAEACCGDPPCLPVIQDGDLSEVFNGQRRLFI